MLQEPDNNVAESGAKRADASRGGRAALVAEGLVRHGPWLRTVVLARLRDADAASDVLQQVAEAATKNAHRLEDASRLAPWLYRIAVTESLMHRRRLGRNRGLMARYRERAPRTETDSEQPDPLDWLVADEQRQIVRQALRTLPGRDREVLLLKYTQDWSYRQLAEHLGASQHAIEGRLQRARKKLRSSLLATDPTLAQP